MEPCLRATDFCCDPFEAIINGAVRESVSDLIGEDEMAVHPARADKEALPGLLLAVKLQELHHLWGNRDPSRLVALGRGEVVLTTFFL